MGDYNRASSNKPSFRAFTRTLWLERKSNGRSHSPYLLSCGCDHPRSCDLWANPPNITGEKRARLNAGERRRVARASRGDVAAFEQLVREHSGLVRSVSTRILGREEAPDACQEVWIRVWRHLGEFRADSSFTTWLYRVSTNTCLSLRRKETRREEYSFVGGAPDIPEPSGTDADPETSALGSERRAEVGQHLRRMRKEHRAALVLRHVEGLSYTEIAEALDIPSGTAKGWASRGRAAMLAALS